MITGRLIELNSQYYAVLNLKHTDGRRWQKRINLDMPVKNNKRRADEKLIELRKEYTRFQQIQNNSPDLMLSDFIFDWLAKKEPDLSPTTHRNYYHIINRSIVTYFKDSRVKDVSGKNIEAYYTSLADQGLSTTTIQHHHMILIQVFREACRKEIIGKDPMLFVDKPKRQPPNVNYYSSAEAQKLWDAVTGHKLEIIIKLTLFYGFRRSEVLGVRWADIDFNTRTISINRAIVDAVVDGKRTLYEKSELKGKASKRTMPLCDMVFNLLQHEYETKKHFDSPYVCTDKHGQLISPDETTHRFRKLLKEENLRLIRFHDLRHTCASLLIAARTPLIEVQHWLGHSTMLTTADLYSHLEYAAKVPNAEIMKKFLK